MKRTRHLALIEQALISGSNFIFYLYAARSLSKDTWGELSLALGLVLVIQGFQRAFVTIPMVTSGKENQLFATSLEFWKRIQLIVSSVLLSILLLSYALSLMFFEEWIQRTLLYAVLLVVPIFYLEFVRRITVMSHNMVRLVGMAVAYVLVLSIAIGSATLLEWESTPLVLLACICAASVAGIVSARVPLLAKSSGAGNDGWTSATLWSFGRWAAGSSLAYTGYNFAIQGVLAALSGPAAVGTFAAARNLTQPVSTLIQAIDTVDKPRAGREYASHGIAGLWGVIHRSWSWMFAISIPYLIVVFFYSDAILALLYGTKYQNAGSAVQLWCIVALAMMVSQPLETGLYVVRKPDWLFYGRLLTAVVVLAISPLLIGRWAVNGALIALFLGWMLAAVCAAMQLGKVSPKGVSQ